MNIEKEYTMTKKKILKKAGTVIVPIYKDENGEEYICLSVPDEQKEKKGIRLYQKIERKGDVMNLVGTDLEVYDEDLINIQIGSRTFTFFEQDVEILEEEAK